MSVFSYEIRDTSALFNRHLSSLRLYGDIPWFEFEHAAQNGACSKNFTIVELRDFDVDKGCDTWKCWNQARQAGEKCEKDAKEAYDKCMAAAAPTSTLRYFYHDDDYKCYGERSQVERNCTEQSEKDRNKCEIETEVECPGKNLVTFLEGHSCNQALMDCVKKAFNRTGMSHAYGSLAKGGAGICLGRSESLATSNQKAGGGGGGEKHGRSLLDLSSASPKFTHQHYHMLVLLSLIRFWRWSFDDGSYPMD